MAERSLIPWSGSVLLGLGLAVASCEPPPSGAEAPAFSERDSSGGRVVVSQSPASRWTPSELPVLSIGSVDGGGPEQFFAVTAVRFLPRGGFVVANGGTHELRFFTDDGRFFGSVGGPGSGPDEYRGLTWVAAQGDSVLSYDERNDRVSVRTGSGLLARTFRIDARGGRVAQTAIGPGRSLLVATLRPLTSLTESGTFVDEALVASHGLDGSLLDSIARLPFVRRVVLRDGDRLTTLGLAREPRAGFVADGEGFCHAFGAVFEVRCYGADGSLSLVARVDVEARRYTPELIRRLWDLEVEAARSVQNEPRIRAIERIRAVADFPEHLSAFSRLLADPGGRVWAEVHRLPDEASTEWWIFDQGRRIARLGVDAAFEVMDVDSERIIGVWTDELGVEYVRVYGYGSFGRPG